jgi:AcrR family transcriptional regulator
MTVKQAAKKQLDILAAARELFWKHGFRRVSVEEVCKVAKVSKMTFYRFYSNKFELAKAVFDREVEKSMEHFNQIMNSTSSPEQIIKEIVQIKMEGTKNISKEFLMDFYVSDEYGLKEHIDNKSKEVWMHTITEFKAAQEKGWFRKDLKMEFFFIVSQKSYDLLANEQLMAMYDTPQDLIMEITNFFTYGLLPRNSES